MIGLQKEGAECVCRQELANGRKKSIRMEYFVEHGMVGWDGM
jgi:hypothetical protein